MSGGLVFGNGIGTSLELENRSMETLIKTYSNEIKYGIIFSAYMYVSSVVSIFHLLEASPLV